MNHAFATASSRDNIGGSAVSSTSSLDGMSTTSVAWTTAEHSDTIPIALSPSAFGSDHVGEPCGPPPSEAGSSVSLSSSTATGGGGAARVTSDTAPTVGTGIVAKVDAATVAMAATTPKREGCATTTLFPPSLAAARCRVGL